MQEIPADLLLGVFGEPLTRHVIGPVPLKGMSIEAVILWPRGVDVLQELFSAPPRGAFQVTMAEGPDEQFRLVQPRGIGRRKARTPSISAARPVRRRRGCGVARVAILDQEHPAQAAVSAAKGPQFSNVALGIFLRLDGEIIRRNNKGTWTLRRYVLYAAERSSSPAAVAGETLNSGFA
jgi:hypothetical protein